MYDIRTRERALRGASSRTDPVNDR